MDQALVELNQKIDTLTGQVAFLTEQARIAERQRQDRAELMRDAMPIVNDVYRMTVEQLEEVERYVDLGDLLSFLKRVLRNGRNFQAMLDQLESIMDLMQTVGPLSDAAFSKVVDTLQELERKGYFVFAKGGVKILDNIVTSFGEDDVQQLGDNIVLILQTVKSMTQPEVMNFVQNMVQVMDSEKDDEVDISLMALMRQMRDPDVRRGLTLTMRALRTIGAQTNGHS